VAAAAGLPDGAGAARAETLAAARRLGRGGWLLSVDAEGGFSDDPGEVAEFVAELARLGAVGVNLEDGRADGTLTPAEVHAAKIAAVRAAVPGVFVNARTDTYWLQVAGAADPARAAGSASHASPAGTVADGPDETLRRVTAYQQAGADGVFVPGLGDPERIAALVHALEVPLNVLYAPDGPTVAELGALGVARVSLGSLLFRRALGAAVAAAADVRADRRPSGPVPGYAAVQALCDLGDPGGPGA
jgi:2-methylisocitrate lyase-like PEP mutase family enzyme